MSTQPTRGLGPAAAAQILSLEYPMSLGVHDTYASAQKAVDYLSDHDFPVENVLIVGTDLKQLERVTGRLTRSRVMLGGVLSGAWLGLLIGLIFALFDTSGFSWTSVLATVVFGAIFGTIWAAVGYSVTGGQRDFTSVTQVIATKYEVLTEHKHAARGRELLREMDPMAAAQAELRRAQESSRTAPGTDRTGSPNDGPASQNPV